MSSPETGRDSPPSRDNDSPPSRDQYSPPPRSAYKPPPIRMDSLNFPTDRLPQLGVEYGNRLPGTFPFPPVPHEPGSVASHQEMNPSLPGAVVPDKSLFNMWAETETQTELHWTKPDNADSFSDMFYQIQIKPSSGTEWTDLADNRQPLIRVYFTGSVALFGRTRITQSASTTFVRMRIRPVGIKMDAQRDEEKHFGPWTNDILFSLEGSTPRPPMPPI